MNEMTEGVCRSAHPCRRHSRRRAFFFTPSSFVEGGASVCEH